MDQPDDPRHRLRVSDADREHVAEILRAAAGDGRLDSDELDERLGAAYGAKTVGDLVPLTSDLPEAPPLPRARPDKPSAEPAQDDSQVTHEPAGPERGVAIMSGFERRGDWLVPPQLTVTAVMGGAHIDTRRARFSADEVVITVYAVMGGAEIVVGPRTRVVVEGNGIMGASPPHQKASPTRPPRSYACGASHSGAAWASPARSSPVRLGRQASTYPVALLWHAGGAMKN